MSEKIRFTKMHGAGNDYIYVYVPENHIADPEKCSIEWSKPHFGIGSDGLILVDKLYTMNDVMHFFDNFSSLLYSKICISLVWAQSTFTRQPNLSSSLPSWMPVTVS